MSACGSRMRCLSTFQRPRRKTVPLWRLPGRSRPPGRRARRRDTAWNARPIFSDQRVRSRIRRGARHDARFPPETACSGEPRFRSSEPSSEASTRLADRRRRCRVGDAAGIIALIAIDFVGRRSPGAAGALAALIVPVFQDYAGSGATAATRSPRSSIRKNRQWAVGSSRQ